MRLVLAMMMLSTIWSGCYSTQLSSRRTTADLPGANPVVEKIDVDIQLLGQPTFEKPYLSVKAVADRQWKIPLVEKREYIRRFSRVKTSLMSLILGAGAGYVISSQLYTYEFNDPNNDGIGSCSNLLSLVKVGSGDVLRATEAECNSSHTLLSAATLASTSALIPQFFSRKEQRTGEFELKENGRYRRYSDSTPYGRQNVTIGVLGEQAILQTDAYGNIDLNLKDIYPDSSDWYEPITIRVSTNASGRSAQYTGRPYDWLYSDSEFERRYKPAVAIVTSPSAIIYKDAVLETPVEYRAMQYETVEISKDVSGSALLQRDNPNPIVGYVRESEYVEWEQFEKSNQKFVIGESTFIVPSHEDGGSYLNRGQELIIAGDPEMEMRPAFDRKAKRFLGFVNLQGLKSLDDVHAEEAKEKAKEVERLKERNRLLDSATEEMFVGCKGSLRNSTHRLDWRLLPYGELRVVASVPGTEWQKAYIGSWKMNKSNRSLSLAIPDLLISEKVNYEYCF